MKFLTFISAAILISGSLYILQPADWEILIFLVLALALVVIMTASFNIQWNFFLTSIHKSPMSTLAITFDDGPHETNTARVLDILNEKNAKASFFLIGKNVEAHPEIAKRIVDEGHSVGIHSFSHSRMHGFFSTNRVEREILETNIALSDATGKTTFLYRAPFGVTNPNIAKAVKRTSMKSIGWNIRLFDTMAVNAQELLKKAKIKVNGRGSILLLHDTCDLTVEILPELIEHCKREGIQLNALDEFV